MGVLKLNLVVVQVVCRHSGQDKEAVAAAQVDGAPIGLCGLPRLAAFVERPGGGRVMKKRRR